MKNSRPKHGRKNDDDDDVVTVDDNGSSKIRGAKSKPEALPQLPIDELVKVDDEPTGFRPVLTPTESVVRFLYRIIGTICFVITIIAIAAIAGLVPAEYALSSITVVSVALITFVTKLIGRRRK